MDASLQAGGRNFACFVMDLDREGVRDIHTLQKAARNSASVNFVVFGSIQSLFSDPNNSWAGKKPGIGFRRRCRPEFVQTFSPKFRSVVALVGSNLRTRRPTWGVSLFRKNTWKTGWCVCRIQMHGLLRLLSSGLRYRTGLHSRRKLPEYCPSQLFLHVRSGVEELRAGRRRLQSDGRRLVSKSLKSK